MLDLRLRYEGGGVFRVATKRDFEHAAAEYAKGDLVRAQTSRPRSVRQNAYFHALIEAAFDNQRGGPRVPTWRHLKAHVLNAVGHCDVRRFAPGSLSPEVAAALRQQFDMVEFFVSSESGEIIMKTPRSVAFNALSADEMGEVVDRAVAYICTEIVPGCEPDAIMSMARSKAA